MAKKLMKKVDQKAADKNVESYIVYGKTADSKLYYEAEYTTQVSQEDLQAAFTKGMLLIHTISGTTVTYFRPVSVSDNKAVTIAKSSSSAVPTEWTAAAEASE